MEESTRAPLSVPTRFLKSWIQSHYSERVLACWQAERQATVGAHRIGCALGRAALAGGQAPAVPQQVVAPQTAPRHPPAPDRPAMRVRRPYAALQAAHEALGGSPLDPRLSFETFVLGRSNTLAHAAAKQVTAGPPRRSGDVQPALHPCRRRLGRRICCRP